MINKEWALRAAIVDSGLDYHNVTQKEGSVFNDLFGGEYVYEVEMNGGLIFDVIINPKLNRCYIGRMSDEVKNLQMIVDLFLFVSILNDELKRREAG